MNNKLFANVEKVEFTIGDLKKLIADAPDDGVVVIGGSVVCGAKLGPGRVSSGYYNPTFALIALSPKGNVYARPGVRAGLWFERYGELSTGDVTIERC